MKKTKETAINFILIFSAGLIAAIICQFFTKEPTGKFIHVTSFRYGKKPYAIRCNRGDTLHLSFSTNDTGHSFFLEEFDMDVKVSPGREEVAVFKTTDPSAEPLLTREFTFVARHQGVLNYLVAKSNYRCHVWCGPMHAFEQGKLIILPNTLLFFSLGCIVSIFFLWLTGTSKNIISTKNTSEEKTGYKDILPQSGFLRRVMISRWSQAVLTILTMAMIYIVILTSIFGTKMSGRNLGVLLMWAVWLFLLVAIITPLLGRAWCTICPLPFFGDLFQRKSIFTPKKGKTRDYNNKFSGFFLKWPAWLNNHWLRLFVFMLLATFSTSLIAVPKVSGITVLMLIMVPTLMSLVWELRAFCRFVCPVSVFVSPFSRMSFLAIRNRSQVVCENCKPHYCQKGNSNGWACPYGINVGEMKENSDCGLCLECLRSCTYNNVSIFRRPFAAERSTRNQSEAWLTIAIFTVAVLYSIVYLGPWPAVRDYVNIIDKHNWGLFGVYSIVLWLSVLIIIPGILWLLSFSGKRISKTDISTREIFLVYSGALLPLGLMLWIAFVVPMLFVNITFIIQSASDPFGWGWDFFGTANIPWHQFLPQYIPWLQALLVLTGLYLSLQNLKSSWSESKFSSGQILQICVPGSVFISAAAALMVVFFTN